MKKILYTILFLTVLAHAKSQVKIGSNPTSINTNSILEMETTNKGMLLPRVALDSTTSFAPLTAHIAGMVIYNTVTAGNAPNNVTPGYYFNNGTKWIRLVDATAPNTEPWYNANGNVPATTNTQNIYQMGNVAIGSNNPKATLDVVGQPTVTAAMDGIIAPRIKANDLNNKTYSTNQTGALVYVTEALTNTDNGQCNNILTTGYYFFNGITWEALKPVVPANTQVELGYIVGWTANVTPPSYLLPLNGGVYNWADYPDFKAFNNIYPSQFIASSNATTFTLRNVNGEGRFLRGAQTAGTDQTDATKQPNIPWKVTGAIVNSTMQDSVGDAANGTFGLLRRSTGGSNTLATGDQSAGEPDLITAPKNHYHAILGGDIETRPINTSIIWCLKVKSLPYYGNVTLTSQKSDFEYGDIKSGIQLGDHNGWVKLDGRAKSTLSAVQQARATSLGIGTNLPDATNTYLVQNGTSLGSVSGSNTKMIAQNNLPNVTLGGTTNVTGAHTHTYETASAFDRKSSGTGNGVLEYQAFKSTSTAGDHSHTITTTSINGNVTQAGFDVTPRSLSVNTFIFLGN